MRAPLLLLLALPLVGQTDPLGRYILADGDIIVGTASKDGTRSAISTGSAFWPSTGNVV